MFVPEVTLHVGQHVVDVSTMPEAVTARLRAVHNPLSGQREMQSEATAHQPLGGLVKVFLRSPGAGGEASLAMSRASSHREAISSLGDLH